MIKKNKCTASGAVKSIMIFSKGQLNWEEYLLLSEFADRATKKGESINLGDNVVYIKNGKPKKCSMKK